MSRQLRGLFFRDLGIRHPINRIRWRSGIGIKIVAFAVSEKRADLVVLRGNPLSDIRNTRQLDAVWIAGREVVR